MLLRLQGNSNRSIAKQIGRSHTTVNSELKRNSRPHTDLYGYIPELADQMAAHRKQSASRRPRLKNEKIRKYVHEKLALRWSPEQIEAAIVNDLPNCSISYEAIYQYIYSDYREAIPLLARKHKKRYPRQGSRKRRCPAIKNRTAIDKRPDNVDQRQIFGHWESDSIVSQQSESAINVLVERVSRKVSINKLKNKTASITRKIIIDTLKPLPEQARCSITFDNGGENADHEKINEELGTNSYFCKPYHSWEKGAVENMNGLIRCYIPKKTNLDTVTEEQLKIIENQLNNRPRKCLGFRTPNQVFNEQCAQPPP